MIDLDDDDDDVDDDVDGGGDGGDQAMVTYSWSADVQKVGGILIGWACYGRGERGLI